MIVPERNEKNIALFFIFCYLLYGHYTVSKVIK